MMGHLCWTLAAQPRQHFVNEVAHPADTQRYQMRAGVVFIKVLVEVLGHLKPVLQFGYRTGGV